MAALFARFSSSRQTAGTKNLPADLKKITHSSFINESEIPADALASVVESSKNEEERREIMKHLRECLSEATGKYCHRVLGGLMLLEALVKSGSSDLMVETAEGHHFDLVQRLSFLDHFDFANKTVQGMIRTKAAALRKQVIPLLEGAALKDKELAADPSMETASTASPGSAISNSSNDFASNECNGPKARMIVNNLVSVGHSDDTTSESECGSAKRSGNQQRLSARARNEKSQQLAKDTVVAQVPTQPLDLLDF